MRDMILGKLFGFPVTLQYFGAQLCKSAEGSQKTQKNQTRIHKSAVGSQKTQKTQYFANYGGHPLGYVFLGFLGPYCTLVRNSAKVQ